MSSEQQNPPGSTSPPEQPSSPDAIPRVSLDDDEEVLLANFDRYIDSDLPLNPTRPEPQPTPTPQPSSSQTLQPDPSALAALEVQFPAYNTNSLSSILVSVKNDAAAATALLEGRQPNSSADKDAELAYRLQRREEMRGQRRGQPTDAVCQLERPVMNKVLSTLREIVIPSLRAHFQELILPDVRDDSNSLLYTLEKVQVTALTLPSENVSITPATDRSMVHVNVLNCHLELEVGKWSYENRGMVPVKDSGRASASVHGLNIALRLEPRRSPSLGTRMIIDECTVTVDGIVRLKTHDAAANWAYNAIALVLKPIVVSYIKEAVADSVGSVLAVHLRQWAYSRTLDLAESPSVPASNSPSAAIPTVAEL